jgi:hypothetical protein
VTKFEWVCMIAQFGYTEIDHEARKRFPDENEAKEIACHARALRDAIEEIVGQRSGPAK